MKIVNKTALRYTFSNAKNQKRSTWVIILGVCISLAAMLILSSVMNGLQSSQLDRLRNLDSFDIVVENSNLPLEQIQNIDNVNYAYYFLDANVLITNVNTGNSGTARIRGIDLDSYYNNRTKNDFQYISYSENPGLTLSTTMKNRFSVDAGDSLQVTFLRKGKTTVAPYNRSLKLSGLYVSSLSDFSSNTAFIDINEIASIYGEEFLKIGIFCTEDVESVCTKINQLDSKATITSWKEANRALYSALMLEKALMILFLSFVFIIISVNLKNSTKRLMDYKVGESAILRAYGMSLKSIYKIFIIQGVIATSIGSFAGLVLGYLAVRNMPFVLNIADRLIYTFTGNYSYLSSVPLGTTFNWVEAIITMVYIFGLTVLFAYLGCRKIHKLQVMEVLSNASTGI